MSGLSAVASSFPSTNGVTLTLAGDGGFQSTGAGDPIQQTGAGLIAGAIGDSIHNEEAAAAAEAAGAGVVQVKPEDANLQDAEELLVEAKARLVTAEARLNNARATLATAETERSQAMAMKQDAETSCIIARATEALGVGYSQIAALAAYAATAGRVNWERRLVLPRKVPSLVEERANEFAPVAWNMMLRSTELQAFYAVEWLGCAEDAVGEASESVFIATNLVRWADEDLTNAKHKHFLARCAKRSIRRGEEASSVKRQRIR